jgi:hypothetical protein
LPHSATSGSLAVCASPELFAAYRGLPRLRVPRHPPHAFVRLTTDFSIQAKHARFLITSDETSLLVLDSLSQRSTPTIRCQTAKQPNRDLGYGGVRQILENFRVRLRELYSFLRKGGDPAAGSPTATLLRLRPSHPARLRRLGPLARFRHRLRALRASMA